MDTPSRREVLQHSVESDSVVPPAIYQVVEAIGPEGGPLTAYLDYEDAGRGLEARLEGLGGPFSELACEEKRISEPLIRDLFDIA